MMAAFLKNSRRASPLLIAVILFLAISGKHVEANDKHSDPPNVEPAEHLSDHEPTMAHTKHQSTDTHEHHDHPASPEISVAHHAQENDQHQGDSSGHHDSGHHTDPLPESDSSHNHSQTHSSLAAASHHDGLTTHPTADSESDSPAISEPTPAVKNDFTDEIALPGEQNAKTEEVPLSKSHPQIESVSEASPISSDLIDDSNILKQKSSEISEPSVELTLELQRASEVVRAASPTQQAAFIKTIPDYAFAKDLGELMTKLEINTNKLNEILANIENNEKTEFSSKTFDDNLEDLKNQLFQLNKETESLASKADDVAKIFAERVAKTKQDTIKLSVEVQLAMPKIPESVHNSLSSLNSSIASSLRVLLTGSRQKNEHQHDYIEILESDNNLFQAREKTAGHKINEVVAQMNSFKAPEDEKDRHSNAIQDALHTHDRIKTLDQKHQKYIEVENKYKMTEAEKEEINGLNDKLVEEIEGIQKTNDKSMTSFANLISFLNAEKAAPATTNSALAVHKRRKREAQYEAHMAKLTTFFTEITERMANLKKSTDELSTISQVDDLAEAIQKFSVHTDEILKASQWNNQYAHLAVKNINDANAVHDFLTEIRAYNHKDHEAVGKHLVVLNNELQTKTDAIVTQLTIWSDLLEKSIENLKAIPNLNKDKHEKLMNGLKKMNTDRDTFLKSFAYYLQTHGLANKVHKKFEKLQNRTKAAEKDIEVSMQEAMKKAASGENYDERHIGDELFNRFEADYDILKTKLEKLDEKHASLNEKRGGLHDEHDKNLNDQLNEIEKEIAKVKTDIHTHNSNIAGHKADAAVINDMLKVEKSLKEFERKTDRAEEELHQLYKHVEESLEHEFLADELDKLNKLEEDFNHMKGTLEGMKEEFEKLHFAKPSVHDQSSAESVRKRIESRIDNTISSMHEKQTERVKKIKEFRAYVFAHGHKNLNDAEFAHLTKEKEELAKMIKRRPDMAVTLRKKMEQLNERMEEIKKAAAIHHDGLHETSSIRKSLQDLENRLNSVIKGSDGLIVEVKHIHSATQAEEKDRIIRKELKKILTEESGDFRKLGKDIDGTIQGVENTVKTWAGFRPVDEKIETYDDAKLKEILAVKSYTPAHKIEEEVNGYKKTFEALEQKLRVFETEEGKNHKGGTPLETAEFKGQYAYSQKIHGKIIARQSQINAEIEKLVKDLKDREKLLEEQKKQSLEEIKAIEASVRLLELKDSMKEPVNELEQIAPKLERDALMAHGNCDETFMNPEKEKMHSFVTLADHLKAKSAEEHVSEEAKVFYNLVQILKQKVTDGAGILQKDANALIETLVAFVQEMMDNIKANVTKYEELKTKVSQMKMENARLVKDYEESRRASKETSDKISKEVTEEEVKNASKAASKEASREADEKVERMASEEEDYKQQVKKGTKASLKESGKKSRIAEIIANKKKAMRIKHHKELEELIKKLLAMRKEMLIDEGYFTSTLRNLFLSEEQKKPEKPECVKHIDNIDNIWGQLSKFEGELVKMLKQDSDAKKHTDQPYIKAFTDLGIQTYIEPLEQQMIRDGNMVKYGNDIFSNKQYEDAIDKLKEYVIERNQVLRDTPIEELGKLLEEQSKVRNIKLRNMYTDKNGKHDNLAEMKHNYRENYIEFSLNYEKTLNEKTISIEKIKNKVSQYLKPRSSKNSACNDFWPFTPEDGDLVAQQPADFETKLKTVYDNTDQCLYSKYKTIIFTRKNELLSIHNPAKTAQEKAKDHLVDSLGNKAPKNERDVFHNDFKMNVKSGLHKQEEYITKNTVA